MKVTSMKSDPSVPRVYKFRYVILALCTSATLLEYATRTNINNAIVSMVSRNVPSNESSKNFVSDFCPIPKNVHAKLTAAERNETFVGDETFDWDPTTQVSLTLIQLDLG